MVNQFLTALITIIIAVIIYKILTNMLKKLSKVTKISSALLHGSKFALRVIFVLVIVLVLFYNFGASFEQIISFSSISGIIIGFASTEVVSQIVSGIYLILAGPFDVGDLVNINGNEGIISEINLSYVHLRKFDQSIVKIPNKKVLDSKIKNYTIKMTEELEQRNKSPTLEDGKNGKNKLDINQKIMENLEDLLFESDITRFVFDIEVVLGLDSKNALDALHNLCDDYSKIFSYRPTCFLVDLGYRAKIGFRIYCVDPRIILNNYYLMLADIANVLYPEAV
jgi:small-conductance mechanosensitive channel